MTSYTLWLFVICLNSSILPMNGIGRSFLFIGYSWPTKPIRSKPLSNRLIILSAILMPSASAPAIIDFLENYKLINFEENEILDVLKKAKLTFASRTIVMKLVNDFILKLILEENLK